jgi:hypothetical protein
VRRTITWARVRLALAVREAECVLEELLATGRVPSKQIEPRGRAGRKLYQFEAPITEAKRKLPLMLLAEQKAKAEQVGCVQ